MSSAHASITVRRATLEDAGICGGIFYRAFTEINQLHGFPPELPSEEEGIHILQMLFSGESFYCVVAEENGRLVGANCLDERSTIAGLGPVSVDPAAQNRGIGRSLMMALLDRVKERGFAGVRLLQSSFHLRSLCLYASLGFEVREPVAVMTGVASPGPMEGFPVRTATPDDEAACSALCARVHGFPRTGEFSDAVAQGVARVVERQGRLTGYACGFGYFGQAVAESNDDLKALIQSAEEIGGPGILVPIRNAELFSWCLESGMRAIMPMNLMTMGLYNEPRGAWLPSVLY